VNDDIRGVRWSHQNDSSRPGIRSALWSVGNMLRSFHPPADRRTDFSNEGSGWL